MNRTRNDRIASQGFNAEEELKRIRRKYNDLCRQMDEALSETMERSNRIVMETEISNLIMNQVFNASNDGIWAVDRNHKVIRVNRKLLDLLGMNAEEVVGLKCYDLLNDACRRGSEKCPMKQILAGERMIEQEKALTFRSGKTIPFWVTSTPLANLEMSTIGLVETFSDITERKNSEMKLQLANRELELANRKLARLATEDGLTDLHNRRRFDDYLNTEWRRQARERRPISLIMADVDFFKRYNDCYGHQAGDACLKMVAAVIRKKSRRSSDLCARYGGEEFAVVMPGTDVEGGLHVAEMIRQEVAGLRIQHDNSSVAPYLTVSCGVACVIPDPRANPQTLIERADRALYGAKIKGRNCVLRYEDVSSDSVKRLPTQAKQS